MIFNETRASYSTDADIECLYTLTPGVNPQHGDRVGIYNVGCTKIHDYHNCEWAPIPKNSTDQQRVLFKGNNSPSQIDIFLLILLQIYIQFFYV